MHRDTVNFVVVTKCVSFSSLPHSSRPPSPFDLRLSHPTLQKRLTFHLRTEFIITTSVDGHLKFWKKQEVGIEFVKHYRAHLTPVTAVAASTDGQLFASVSEDETAKIFDVVNFGKCLAPFVARSRERKTGAECEVDEKERMRLTCAARHDQHCQAGLQASRLLLGASGGTVARIACYVRLPFLYTLLSTC